MRKAYIVTAVDYGDSYVAKAKTLGVFFNRDEAQKALEADMDKYIALYKEMNAEYTEDELSLWIDDRNGVEWNVEDIEVQIPLTPLQTTEIHGIAYKMYAGDEGAEVFEDLSDEEAEYLKYTLKTTYNYDVDKIEEGK